MCINCYNGLEVDYIENKNVIKASEMIGEIYSNENGICGGHAHVVVDDWNLEDRSIDFCIKECEKDEWEAYKGKLTSDCLKFLKFFKTLSNQERASAMALHYGLKKNK